MGKKTKVVLKNIKKFRGNHDSNRNIFLVCISIVMIWRGVWNLLDVYLLPGHPFFSNIICIALGTIILLIDDGKLGELKSRAAKGGPEK